MRVQDELNGNDLVNNLSRNTELEAQSLQANQLIALRGPQTGREFSRWTPLEILSALPWLYKNQIPMAETVMSLFYELEKNPTDEILLSRLGLELDRCAPTKPILERLRDSYIRGKVTEQKGFYLALANKLVLKNPDLFFELHRKETDVLGTVFSMKSRVTGQQECFKLMEQITKKQNLSQDTSAELILESMDLLFVKADKQQVDLAEHESITIPFIGVFASFLERCMSINDIHYLSCFRYLMKLTESVSRKMPYEKMKEVVFLYEQILDQLHINFNSNIAETFVSVTYNSILLPWFNVNFKFLVIAALKFYSRMGMLAGLEPTTAQFTDLVTQMLFTLDFDKAWSDFAKVLLNPKENDLAQLPNKQVFLRRVISKTTFAVLTKFMPLETAQASDSLKVQILKYISVFQYQFTDNANLDYAKQLIISAIFTRQSMPVVVVQALQTVKGLVQNKVTGFYPYLQSKMFDLDWSYVNRLVNYAQFLNDLIFMSAEQDFLILDEKLRKLVVLLVQNIKEAVLYQRIIVQRPMLSSLECLLSIFLKVKDEDTLIAFSDQLEDVSILLSKDRIDDQYKLQAIRLAAPCALIAHKQSRYLRRCLEWLQQNCMRQLDPTFDEQTIQLVSRCCRCNLSWRANNEYLNLFLNITANVLLKSKSSDASYTFQLALQLFEGKTNYVTRKIMDAVYSQIRELYQANKQSEAVEEAVISLWPRSEQPNRVVRPHPSSKVEYHNRLCFHYYSERLKLIADIKVELPMVLEFFKLYLEFSKEQADIEKKKQLEQLELPLNITDEGSGFYSIQNNLKQRIRKGDDLSWVQDQRTLHQFLSAKYDDQRDRYIVPPPKQT